jgi:PAS domain-containing protein
MAVLQVLGDLPVNSRPSPAIENEQARRIVEDDCPWRAAADLLALPMVLLDTSGAIADANDSFVRAIGFIRGKPSDTRFSELVDPYDRAIAAVLWSAPLRSRRGCELNLRTPLGPRLYSFDCMPVFSKGHHILVLVGRDLTRAGLHLWPMEGEAREHS